MQAVMIVTNADRTALTGAEGKVPGSEDRAVYQPIVGLRKNLSLQHNDDQIIVFVRRVG